MRRRLLTWESGPPPRMFRHKSKSAAAFLSLTSLFVFMWNSGSSHVSKVQSTLRTLIIMYVTTRCYETRERILEMHSTVKSAQGGGLLLLLLLLLHWPLRCGRCRQCLSGLMFMRNESVHRIKRKTSIKYMKAVRVSYLLQVVWAAGCCCWRCWPICFWTTAGTAGGPAEREMDRVKDSVTVMCELSAPGPGGKR